PVFFLWPDGLLLDCLFRAASPSPKERKNGGFIYRKNRLGMAKISLNFRINADSHPYIEHIQHSPNVLFSHPIFFGDYPVGLFNTYSKINLCNRNLSTGGRR